ncbi:uncharacterized protein (TIGR02391 family) [Microbacterium sp. SORGH_AS 505]|uniref:TIGR02391 family protein n=1 Tax=Microbacterium sp. SORGH_AS_0505 TaxID=3041770 RepID=UPI0027865FAD|nr:TIGR02391 family protein [Microbacterium sp. SORGH_AS_0505]MDQ1126475.1 uncharacterized protein (TIGR02391 family) [Microbacterium sp. SORGH_AS_0505]
MSQLTVGDRTFLEAALQLGGGYVLDFSNSSFAQFFDALGIDIFEERYAEYGTSKANRLRAFWKLGTELEVSASLTALADYVQAKRIAEAYDAVTDDHEAKIREIASSLAGTSPLRSTLSGATTTEATVTKNLISIEIHEDIYGHIQRYLATDDYFHAVEESYKVVREKLRELTGSERSTDVFNENAQSNKHYSALLGKSAPAGMAEADFFRGIGYLHLGVQFLRNEKAHSLATFVEPNLAIHYISLASLAYDLITRFLSEETVAEIEELVRAKRKSYRSVRAFYADFEDGKWLQGISLPGSVQSASARRLLKARWLEEADLTKSYDHSNMVFMRLELVVDELTEADLDLLIDLPTEDSYGNDQEAGMWPFLEFVQRRDPGKLSERAKKRLAEFAAR